MKAPRVKSQNKMANGERENKQQGIRLRSIESGQNLKKINSERIINHQNSKSKPKTTDRNRKQNDMTNSLLRSKIFSVHLIKNADHSTIKLSNPYDKFVKDLNIVLPTPKQKFIEFLQIPPFNRLSNHIEFISHILQKNFEFFRKHPVSLVDNIARKIVILDPNMIPVNYLVILDEGTCYYDYFNPQKGENLAKMIKKGSLIVRNNFDSRKFSSDPNSQLSLIGLHYHDYSSFVSQYLNENMDQFKSFLLGIQVFKIFPEQALQKIFASLSVNFYVKGEALYNPGDEANNLFVIYSGGVARKIIVQLDKTNKIPLQGFSKLVKVMSKSYEHRIEFQKEDLVGISQILDNLQARSEVITISEDATILAIDRNAIEENLDEYIEDRLRKYNMRKYPKNYDQLCENYLKEKMQNRRTEQRKIAALMDEYNRNNNEKKTQKISNIIKLYQDRIKRKQNEHLIEHKKIERVVQSDT